MTTLLLNLPPEEREEEKKRRRQGRREGADLEIIDNLQLIDSTRRSRVFERFAMID